MHLVNGTGNSPTAGQPTPGVVKQDTSSRGSVDTTKTCSGPQRVRMSSGEMPIGAAKGKQSDAEALCQTPPLCTCRRSVGHEVRLASPIQGNAWLAWHAWNAWHGLVWRVFRLSSVSSNWKPFSLNGSETNASNSVCRCLFGNGGVMLKTRGQLCDSVLRRRGMFGWLCVVGACLGGVGCSICHHTRVCTAHLAMPSQGMAGIAWHGLPPRPPVSNAPVINFGQHGAELSGGRCMGGRGSFYLTWGAHRALCARGPRVLNSAPYSPAGTPGIYCFSLMLATGPRVLNSAPPMLF